MKKYVFIALVILAISTPVLADVYVIEYEAYNWNPCNGNVCFTIDCGLGGCHVDGKYIVCADQHCVMNILDESGEEHLVGIWKIDYKNRTSKPVKYQRRYKIESELR